MQFLIKGIDRKTGQPMRQIHVEASSERDALEEATRRGMFTEAIEEYVPPPLPSISEPVPPAPRVPLAGKQPRPKQSRVFLMIACGALLLFSCPCVLAPFGEFKGHRVGPSQSQAFDQFRQGERLSESEVVALTGDEWHVSPAEEQAAAWKFFWAGFVLFQLPAALIAVHLYRTRQEAPNADPDADPDPAT